MAAPLYVCYTFETATRRQFYKQAQLQAQQQQQVGQPAQELEEQQLPQAEQQQQGYGDGEGEDTLVDDAALQRQLARVRSSSAAVDAAAGWAVHLLLLLAMLLGCWLLANAVALNLLPRVISSQQLARWCPNKPHVPYRIAGHTYG